MSRVRGRRVAFLKVPALGSGARTGIDKPRSVYLRPRSTVVPDQLDGKRPTGGCGARKARVRHASTRSRQPVKLDYFRVADCSGPTVLLAQIDHVERGHFLSMGVL